MKKVLVIIGILTIGVLLVYGQYGFVDCPSRPTLDTLNTTTTRVTMDMYFNAENSPTERYGQVWIGPVDLNVYLSRIYFTSGSDSVIIEAYGMKRVLAPGATTWTTAYVDSHRVTTLAVDSTWHSYPIDPLWADFPIFDGIRYVFKINGTDEDTTGVSANQRIWPQGGAQ